MNEAMLVRKCTPSKRKIKVGHLKKSEMDSKMEPRTPSQNTLAVNSNCSVENPVKTLLTMMMS